MLKYIFSFMLFASYAKAKAQEQEQKKDSVIYIDRYGLRIGTDIYKLTRNLYDKDYKGFEFNADFRVTKKIYAAAEISFENKQTLDDRIDYNTKGTFAKLGANINFYQNWLDMDNQIYLGGRYAFANFKQQLNAFRVYQINPPTGENVFIPANNFNTKTLSAHWIEIVLGFQAELLPNIYGGVHARLNYMITQNQPDNFNNLYINGFGRVHEGSNFGASFNYTLSYFIPLIKKPKTKVEEKE